MVNSTVIKIKIYYTQVLKGVTIVPLSLSPTGLRLLYYNATFFGHTARHTPRCARVLVVASLLGANVKINFTMETRASMKPRKVNDVHTVYEPVATPLLAELYDTQAVDEAVFHPANTNGLPLIGGTFGADVMIPTGNQIATLESLREHERDNERFHRMTKA